MSEFTPKVKVMLSANDKTFGPGTCELLKAIDRLGSLQQACNEMELSYSKGAKMIKKLEQELGYSLVLRWSGGTRGGGAKVSEEGRELIRQYDALSEEIQAYAHEAYQRIFSK